MANEALAQQALALKIKRQSAVAARNNGASSAHHSLRMSFSSKEFAPLSFAQERLCFLETLHDVGASYNTPIARAIRGTLDVFRLQKSLDALVARHESLRTTFELGDDQAAWRQVVHDLRSMPLALIDSQKERKTPRDILIAEASRRFDLTQGPLVRTTLVGSAGSDVHYLLLCFHHTIVDAASAMLLMDELSCLYAAGGDAEKAGLDEQEVRYVDFAAWQRHDVQEVVYKNQLGYWCEALRGHDGLLDMPTDFVRPERPSFKGTHHHFAIETQVLEKARAFARAEGASLFMVLMASLQAVLSRWSRQDDIVVGFPVAGRREETKNIVGFFVNTLALRTDLSDRPDFRAMVRRVRTKLLDVYTHQDVPFERIVSSLGVARDPSRHPLFQVMMSHYEDAEAPMGDLSTSHESVDLPFAQFDVSLTWRETATGLYGDLEYATDLFQAETMARLSGHLSTFLKKALAEPDVAVQKLSILTQDEEDLLLRAWNDTMTAVPEAFAHELIASCAAKDPAAPAVILNDRVLTHGELEILANRLAHVLRDRGVGPETLVGICLERSVEMIVAVLAVLKAGGAYVPMDPDYPEDRLAFMAEDAGLKLLLTQRACANLIRGYRGESLMIEDWADLSKDKPATAPEVALSDENLAYVIYTSGSTSKPKGVLVQHGNLKTSLYARTSYYENPKRSLLIPPLAFDSSVAVVFGTLAVGGCLVVLKAESLRDPQKIGDLIEKHQVDMLLCVPSLYLTLMEYWQVPERLALRQVIVAGEASSDNLIEKSRAILPCARVFNEYGPTEATIWCTVKACDHVGKGEKITIGKPIKNAHVYVLDAERNPVPVGVTGELYVGGPLVTRGYLNRPELTAEKFVSSPFREGERLYRTGDLVRWTSQGELDFLGRIDYQIKLRGYRIEPGEIESILSEQTGVVDVAVLAQGVTPTDRQLVAYLTQKNDGDIDPEAVRTALQARLPHYMVPSAFVVMDRFPLTPNGKLDRKALPMPQEVRERHAVKAQPENALQESIAKGWKEVLGLEHVGIDDNFFDVGGNSLRVVKMRKTLADAGITIPDLIFFFKYPTIRAFAEALCQQGQGESAADEMDGRSDRIKQMRARRSSMVWERDGT